MANTLQFKIERLTQIASAPRVGNLSVAVPQELRNYANETQRWARDVERAISELLLAVRELQQISDGTASPAVTSASSTSSSSASSGSTVTPTAPDQVVAPLHPNDYLLIGS